MSMNMNIVYCHLHQRKYVAIVHILMMYVIQKAAMLAIATSTHTETHHAPQRKRIQNYDVFC